MSDESENARKFAAQYPAFLRACERLGEIDNLDEAIRSKTQQYAEVQARHEQFVKESEAAASAYQTKLTNLAGEMHRAQTDIADQRSRGHISSEALIATAKKEAEAIVATAKESAKKTVAEGTEVGAKLVAEAKAAADSARAGLADITAKTTAGKRELDEIASYITEASGRLATIETHIAQLKGM